MSSDNLEKLDNVSLREKCLAYGLPNVPITDTSRKILIKKLRLAMDASAGGDNKNSKQRRETIHTTKIPTLKEAVIAEESTKKIVGKTNTRRTIAATSTLVNNDNESTPAPVTQRRRSGRVTPVGQAQPDPVITSKRKTAKIDEEEEEEEDEDEQNFDDIIEAVERAEKALRATPRGRKSRSSSLTKSPVVSTSYNREAGSVVIPEIESDSDVEIINVSYENSKPLAEEKLPYVFSPPQKPIFVEPDVISASRLPTNRSYADSDFFSGRRSVDPDISTINFRPTLTRTSVEAESYKPYASAESFGKGTFQKTSHRYTTGTGLTSAPSYAKRYTTYVENSDDAEDDSANDLVKTPYYSDFAQKLEQLKKETYNLNSRGISAKRETTNARVYGSSKILSRPSVGHKESFIESCRAYMVVLDQKYKIKRNILIALLLLLILTIYVFLFN